MSSLKVGNSLFSDTFIPREFTFEHYVNLFQNTRYPLWFMNTLKVAALSTIFGTFLLLLSSYAISRYRFAGRRTTLTTLLVLQMFPGFMAMIAIYVLLNTMGLLELPLGARACLQQRGDGDQCVRGQGLLRYDSEEPGGCGADRRREPSALFFSIMIPLSRPMLTYAA